MARGAGAGMAARPPRPAADAAGPVTPRAAMTAAAAGSVTGRSLPAVVATGDGVVPERTAAGARACAGTAEGLGGVRGRSSGVTAAASRPIAATKARIGRGGRGSCCHVAAAVHGSATSRQPTT